MLDQRGTRIDELDEIEKKLTETNQRLDSITESMLRSIGEAVIRIESKIDKIERRTLFGDE
jgi:hypothetical protein